MKRFWVLSLSALAWGCDQGPGPGVVCTAIAVAGLDVGVASDRGAQGVCDATVTATDGSYRERLTPTSCRYVGAYERPGTYVLHVERTDFLAREVRDVRVIMAAGECPHPQTVRLDIQISPTP